MKKFISILLAVILVFGITACTQNASTGNEEPAEVIEETFDTETEEGLKFTPGKYQASAMGMRGDIKVEVEVDANSIKSVKVVDNVDTKGIADTALEVIPGKIVEGQTLAVDTVSGATMTSYGILRAAEAALKDAGADLSLLKVKADKEELKEGPIEEYDVVVVGSGASGLSAAIELTKEGSLKVLVLEKLAYPGGSSRVCGGGIWAIGDSIINKNVEVDYIADEYIEFMETLGETTLNRDLMKNIHKVSAETFDYLIERGLPVNTTNKSLGHPQSNFPVAWANINSTVKYNEGYGGKAIMDSIFEIAQENGAEVRLNSKVTSLVVEDGSVKGVKVEGLDSKYTVNAKKVILATGGFTRNIDLIKELAPEFAPVFAFTGAGSTGDGITLTKDLDTVIVGEGMMGLTGYNPNYGYYGAEGAIARKGQIYINKEGKQFGAEKAFYGQTLALFNNQTDHMAYAICDQNNSDVEGFENGVKAGLVTKADTIEELASKLDVDADAMIETVKENGLENAPYYAMEVRPLFIGSIPGLKVSENTEVVNSKNEVIPNLYAVGELTFGNTFNNYYPSSGTGMGTSVYTGAIAAKHIVEQLAK